jgi:hypothetical protein
MTEQNLHTFSLYSCLFIPQHENCKLELGHVLICLITTIRGISACGHTCVCVSNKSCFKLWHQTFETPCKHLQLTRTSVQFHWLMQVSSEIKLLQIKHNLLFSFQQNSYRKYKIKILTSSPYINNCVYHMHFVNYKI